MKASHHIGSHEVLLLGPKAPSLNLQTVCFLFVLVFVVLHVWYMLMSQLYILRAVVREIRAGAQRWGSADLLHTNIIGRLGGLVDKYT